MLGILPFCFEKIFEKKKRNENHQKVDKIGLESFLIQMQELNATKRYMGNFFPYVKKKFKWGILSGRGNLKLEEIFSIFRRSTLVILYL